MPCKQEKNRKRRAENASAMSLFERAPTGSLVHGPRKIAEKGRESGVGFRIPGGLQRLGRGVDQGLVRGRPATRVIWPRASIFATWAISFSRPDFKSCRPREFPAVQTCERK